MDTRELNLSSAARKAANEIMAVGCLSEVEIAAIIERYCGEGEKEREALLHALKNAWATLSYMSCMCGHGFVCGRCNSFNEADALLKKICGDDWFERYSEDQEP